MWWAPEIEEISQLFSRTKFWLNIFFSCIILLHFWPQEEAKRKNVWLLNKKPHANINNIWAMYFEREKTIYCKTKQENDDQLRQKLVLWKVWEI